MRLYSTSGATQVDDPVCGTFTAGRNGAFDFPDELSARLHPVCVGKKRQWETDDERVKRVSEEELESVRDPAALLAAVKDIGSGQNVLVAALAKMLGLDAAGAPAAAAEPAADPQPEKPAATSAADHAADPAPSQERDEDAAEASAASKKPAGKRN